MFRAIPALLSLFVAVPNSSNAQAYCNGQICASDGSAVNLNTVVTGRVKMIYTNNGTVTVGPSSNLRSTMLPTAATGSSLLLKANTFIPGTCLNLKGSGTISAATAPGNFVFTPYMQDNGGTKTDLPGFTAPPLLATTGITWWDITFCQTTTGITYQGILSYAAHNTTTNYPVMVNVNGTDVTSDYTTDRTFGVDGQWKSSNASNYLIVQMVTVVILPLSP